MTRSGAIAIAVAILSITLIMWAFRSRIQRSVRAILSGPEWMMLIRLAALVIMILALLHASIDTYSSPQEFIYGRF